MPHFYFCRILWFCPLVFVDIAAPAGTPIAAMFGGRVTAVGENDSLGQYILSGGKANVFLDNVQIEDMLSSIENSKYYAVKKSDCTIEEALNEFAVNRKLLVILFTKNGQKGEMPLGIMTGADVIEAQKVLENS